MEKVALNPKQTFSCFLHNEFFLNQIRNEFMETKNTYDSVVSTLERGPSDHCI